MGWVIKNFRKRLTVGQKLFAFVMLIVLLGYLVLNYLNANVNPVIVSFSEAKVRSLSVKAVNNAIAEVVVDPNVYNDLITISQNELGEVTLIKANPIEINSLTKELAQKTLTNLENIGTSGIQIPIGSFSGVTVLSGLGPKVSIRLLPVGSINCNFTSEFISAGINQTNHKIYVNIETKVRLVLPMSISSITTTNQMLICESIIVGKVPEVYLDTEQAENSLNLIPE